MIYDLHAEILCKAFTDILGKPERGTIAFIRCLTSDVVEKLSESKAFVIINWNVQFVTNQLDHSRRLITADQAVEMRESKSEPTILIVDTDNAGAGMDGIFSATREVYEDELFCIANRIALREITKCLSSDYRKFAEQIVKKSRYRGIRSSISPWTEFDFYIRCSVEKKNPGHFAYLLGLWPIDLSENINKTEITTSLITSTLFIEKLFGVTAAGMTITKRIDTLRLDNPTKEQKQKLENYLHKASTKPLLQSLSDLSDLPDLWINRLLVESTAGKILDIQLTPWRNKTGKIVNWSGLTDVEEENDPPIFILDPNADQNGNYQKLEIRWKSRPENIEKDSVEYRVSIITDTEEEELASKSIWHSAKKEEKCRFTNDDFLTLSEDALISVKIQVSVVGYEDIKQDSDEFIIQFGDPPQKETGGVGKKVRSFSEGLIDIDSHETITELSSSTILLPEDKKGYVLLRTPQKKTYRVFRPNLIRKVEQQWIANEGAIGRWIVNIRGNGIRANNPEFKPFAQPESFSDLLREQLWERVINASNRMSKNYSYSSGGVGQIHDDKSKLFEITKEYILAWIALLNDADYSFALVNTIEIQSLSGNTIGLIVLPNHPLRIAWHVAYDNLLFHMRFDQNMKSIDIQKEIKNLDGSMFPAFLPGIDNKSTFVFSDMLGFHSVGMVLDSDKEPKAAIALLSKALNDGEMTEIAPTVGKQSAQILGNEIRKYLECHDVSKFLHIHALRPGDGLTMARSLGEVQKHYHKQIQNNEFEIEDEVQQSNSPSFVLELYPSKEKRGVAGHFISEIREKRRSGAGVVSQDDQWMLDSQSIKGGINLPRLRWARKDSENPNTAAHLAIAFDTFESRVILAKDDELNNNRPMYAFGLISFFERYYSNIPNPMWRCYIPTYVEGEKHPSDRVHSDRLLKMQQAIHKCVVRNLGGNGDEIPLLQTEINPDKAHSLQSLHQLCDWVVTVDRNAGIEYFDSPRENKDIYDAYVIDCVPEREDLGCLQLITSTSNHEEVRNLFDRALNQMGLSHSRRNAAFLFEHLKALSGRLAIRLTGQKVPPSELIALALCNAHCLQANDDSEEWLTLSKGYFVPIDDIIDLIFPFDSSLENEESTKTRPDLIYVTLGSRKGLSFRFVEVKYRKHLRAASNPDQLQRIRNQIESFQKKWYATYIDDNSKTLCRSIRRAKLARVLRFYADKAHRHFLTKEVYDNLVSEINRMISDGENYKYADQNKNDIGWIFCPEYAGMCPFKVSPDDWDTHIYLFGPSSLPDSDFREYRRNISEIQFDDHTRDSDVSSTYENTNELQKDNSAETKRNKKNISSILCNNKDVSENTKLKSDALICFGNNLFTETKVNWSITTKGNPHLMLVGLPGMGKTTCLINLCKQMLEQQVQPIVFSYHEDIDVKLEEMVGTIRFIDFKGLSFNPLRVIDRDNKNAYLDVAGIMRDILLAIFPELGDIQGELIRNAIKQSFVESGWDNTDIENTQIQEPKFKRFFEILKEDPSKDRGLKTLRGRLQELDDYGFFDSSDEQHSIWESKEPVIIRIHKTQNYNLQKAFAALIFYGLYKDMFRRGIKDNITHSIIFDEAHRAAGLELIPTMAKECRKYGISFILASQEARDFNVSLYSAIANYLILRLTDTDAKALIRNVARSDQERSLIDKIKQMDRFKALYFCEGKYKPSYLSLQKV